MTAAQVFLAGVIVGGIGMTVLLVFLLPLEPPDGR